MERSKSDNIGAILLAIFSALVILVFTAGAIFALAGGIAEWRETRDATLSLFPSFLLLSAFLLASFLIGRSGLLALRRVRNRPDEAARLQPISFGLTLALFGGWLLSIVAAAALSRHAILQWFALPLYLLALGLPVYALVRLAAGGLELGSKLRAWGTLSMGMTLSPFLAILAEGVVALMALLTIGIFVGLDPQRLEAIQKLGEQLQNVASQEEALALLLPLLTNPLTLAGGLVFLSLVTPLVEEAAKSLPVWLAWRRLDSPARGFALGAISGAGFGLMEGLFVSAAPGETWGMTLAVRAASSAMHIVTAGLVGWGIGQAARQNRLALALGGYALGVFIHGVWNACVVIMVYASGRILLTSPGAIPDIASALIAASVFCFLGLLILAAPFALWAVNRRLRTSLPAPIPVESAETETLPAENMVG